MKSVTHWIAFMAATAVVACGDKEPQQVQTTQTEEQVLMQSPDDLIEGQVMAVAYSGFREGQYPDRGEGANNPTPEQIVEDLNILIENDFRLIRLYDAGENSRTTLELIRENQLPMKVMLGLWLNAEFSNHEGCPWLDAPIPEEALSANRVANDEEVARGIALAKEFADIIVAVNVGNEALVDWTDHMVPLPAMIEHVRTVKSAIEQPVTVAENYEWWISDGKPLAAELDFVGVHTYPAWEGKPIEEGVNYTDENMQRVYEALPDSTFAILEAGWATTATEFGARASEENQAIYYDGLHAWGEEKNVTVFFFEAFDEPWKGNPNNAEGAEKHWGLFFVDRTPKARFRR
ncbi:MAG: glycosyl hydrolase [Pseudomonadota bacterium]